MTIAEAQEYSREHGLTACRTDNNINIDKGCYDAIAEIESALDNGYQLCRIDEVIDTMNRRALFTDNIHPKMLSLGTAIRIVKEACE